MVSIITPLSTVRQDKVEKNQAHYSVMYYYKWKLQCDQNSTEEGEQEHNNNNQARAMMVLSTGAWTQVKGHKIKVTRSKVTKSRSRVTRLKCTTWFVSVGLGLSHWKKAACRQRVGSCTSSLRTMNTGAPQGCVLSPVLFILYTNSFCASNPGCQILKYADDTVVIGLIKDSDESY